VIGGEERKSQDIFRKLCNEEFAKFGPVKEVLSDKIVATYLGVGTKTIRTIEKHDSTIGSTIRYAIIRRGFPLSRGCL
jgi:hypothetical protein